MTALASKTTLLPIIGRADTLDGEEAQRLQLLVHEALNHPQSCVKELPAESIISFDTDGDSG